MTHKITVETCKLSDGSVCYDVTLGVSRFPAISEVDAEDFAAGLGDLIAKHTNEAFSIERHEIKVGV
jgi:hypothetical protein